MSHNNHVIVKEGRRPRYHKHRDDPTEAPAKPQGTMSWLKSSYVIAGIGLVASALAAIKSAPEAWAAAMRMVGRPACINYADAYATTYSTFDHTGADWREVKDGKVVYKFKEAGRDLDFIYLQNLTSRPKNETAMKLRLPVCGGMAQQMLPTAQSWKDVVLVHRA